MEMEMKELRKGREIGREVGSIDGKSEYKRHEELKVVVGVLNGNAEGCEEGRIGRDGVEGLLAAHEQRKSRGQRGPILNRAGSVLHRSKSCEINPGALIYRVFRAGAGI